MCVALARAGSKRMKGREELGSSDISCDSGFVHSVIIHSFCKRIRFLMFRSPKFIHANCKSIEIYY